jgi:hypothetical protein
MLRIALLLITVMVALPCFADDGFPTGCRGTTSWPYRGDGSIPLIRDYASGSKYFELLHRPEDKVIASRRVVQVSQKGYSIVYSILDLENNILVYATHKGITFNEKIKPTTYGGIENYHPLRVFKVEGTFTSQVATLLADHKKNSCAEELLKRDQGREYDKVTCSDTYKALEEVALSMSDTGFSEFVELTNDEPNSYVNRYMRELSRIEGRHPCVEIEYPMLNLITALHKPGALASLQRKQKLPSYLTEQRDFKSDEHGRGETPRYNSSGQRQ